MKNALTSEVAAILGVIDPDVNDQTTVTTDWCDMGLFDQAMCIVLAGTIASGGKLDAQVYQAKTSAGGTEKVITGKAITQLTNTGSDKQQIINVRAEELDVANGYRYIALRLTPDGTNSPPNEGIDSAGLVIGIGPRYGPAYDNDLASVSEIVN